MLCFPLDPTRDLAARCRIEINLFMYLNQNKYKIDMKYFISIRYKNWKWYLISFHIDMKFSSSEMKQVHFSWILKQDSFGNFGSNKNEASSHFYFQCVTMVFQTNPFSFLFLLSWLLDKEFQHQKRKFWYLNRRILVAIIHYFYIIFKFNPIHPLSAMEREPPPKANHTEI